MINKEKLSSKDKTNMRVIKVTFIHKAKGKSKSFNRHESDIFYSESKNQSLSVKKSISPRQRKILETINDMNISSKQMIFLQSKLNKINNKITKANIDSINFKSNYKNLQHKIENKLKEKENNNNLHSTSSTPLLLIKKYNDEILLPTINTNENVNVCSFRPFYKSEKKVNISKSSLLKHSLNVSKEDNIVFNNEEIIKCLKRNNKLLMSIQS